MARAIREAAFREHLRAAGPDEPFVEPVITLAGSSVTGHRGATTGPEGDRPPRPFGPRQAGEAKGSDYDWNAAHEALAERHMGRWDDAREKPRIVHDDESDESVRDVVDGLRRAGGVPGVDHNVMFSRVADAARRNHGRPTLRRSNTPEAFRTPEERVRRQVMLERERSRRQAQIEKEKGDDEWKTVVRRR
ncbi:MAG: hypothetical protein MRZ79_11655 [Bacteroidia bacterium]|nr:hypothetical protein [Bacteroidia bacterium]